MSETVSTATEPFRLHYLVYAPRSGSTIFARTLSAEYPGSLIVPEFRTAEFLLARSERRVLALNQRSLRRVFDADRQLETNLGIGRPAARELSRKLAGAGTLAILTAIITTYAEDATSRDVVLKLGGGAAFLGRLQEISPQGSIVHVYRDGRAAVSSLLRTPRAYFQNENMGRNDIAHCCAVWLRHQRSVRRTQGSGYPVVPVRYESFVEGPAAACRRAAQSMGLRKEEATSVRPFAVSTAESGLHPLVTDPASVQRQGAWRAEMPRAHQVFANWRLGGELNRLGYSEGIQPRARRGELVRCIISAYASHAAMLCRYTVSRSVTYSRQPGAVAEHVNSRLASILSKRRDAR